MTSADIPFSRRRALALGLGAAGTIALPGALTGCGARSAAASGSALSTVALSDNFGPFDPITATTITSVVLNYHVFEGLVDLDQSTRKPYLALASDWPEQVAKTAYRVRLRPGARFQDGSPVRAEDVAYSVERTRHDETSFFAQFIPYVDGAEVVDDTTVDVVFSEPSGLIDEALTQIRVVPKRHLESVGAEAFAASPVGSGPYAFEEAQTNRSVVMRRASTYNGPRPGTLERITFSIVTDGPVRISALRSRDVAAIESPSDFDLEVLSDAGFEVERRPGFLMSFLMTNCAEPPFDDPRVRRALHHAIDSERVTQLAFAGNARVPTSYLPENHPAHVRVREQYPYDPERARRLLAEAGHPDGLRFRLHVYDTAWNRSAATVIQQNWAEIGVEVDQLVGGENLYADVYGGTFEAMLAIADQSVFGWDANTVLSWHYGDVWPEQLFYWSAPERERILDLLARARSATSGAEQQAAWAQVQELIAEQVPLYPVAHREVVSAYDPRRYEEFEGISVGGLDMRTAVPAGGAR